MSSSDFWKYLKFVYNRVLHFWHQSYTKNYTLHSHIYIYAKAQFKQKEDILYVCISFLPLSSSSYFLWYSIFLHMFCNITHSISYDISFLPLFVINLARSPQMIGSCCQTPCDHINLSLWRYQFMMVSIYLFDDINLSLWWYHFFLEK